MMGTAETIPRDLLTLREAAEVLEMSTPRLKFWYLRGIVRSWKLNNRILVSRAEVRRELRRRDGVVARKRKGYMGELEALEAAPEQAALSAPRLRNPTAPPPLPEPSAEHAAEWTPGGPWGYTVD